MLTSSNLKWRPVAALVKTLLFCPKVVERTSNKLWHIKASEFSPGDENQDAFTCSLETKSSIILSHKTRQKDHTHRPESNGFVRWQEQRKSPKTRLYCLSQPYNDVRTLGCFGLSRSGSGSPINLHLALGKKLILDRLHWNYPEQVKPQTADTHNENMHVHTHAHAHAHTHFKLKINP